MSYCQYCSSLPDNDIHKRYHDEEYGFEEKNSNLLFERHSLEIFQAGLSWDIILKKRTYFRHAFNNWDLQLVSQYKTKEIEKLMRNDKIVRHRLKIESIIYNAKVILEIEQQHKSYYHWLTQFKDKSIEDCVLIFKKKFKFVGTEIVKEFLQGICILNGAHDFDCSKYKKT